MAIELPAELKEELRQVQRTLSDGGIEDLVRWVKPAGMHLTLKFLGSVPANKIKSVEMAVAQASQGAGPFKIALRGLGCFPTPSRPNVIWVGVEGDLGPLAALQRGIEDSLAALGFAPERREYTPHLTLGRVGKQVDSRQRRRIGELTGTIRVDSLGEMQAREVSLIRSDLSPAGARYTRLAAIPLGGGE